MHTFMTRWVVVATLLMVVSSCAPRAARLEPLVRVKPATQQPSASPVVVDVRKLSTDADVYAAVAANRVSQAGKRAKDTQTEMQQLIDVTQKLHQQKLATESDLLKLYNQLVDQEQRVSLLAADISEAERALASERTMRQQVSAKLSEIEALTRAKDAEALQLRDQLTHMSDVAEAQRKMAGDNAVLVGKESARADRVAGESALKTRLLIITGSLLLVACLIIFLLVRAKLPI